jgi:hypothetical protein
MKTPLAAEAEIFPKAHRVEDVELQYAVLMQSDKISQTFRFSDVL